MRRNTLTKTKNPLRFSGFPKGFTWITRKEEVANEDIRDFLDRLDTYLVDQWETLSWIEYLYELYIHQNMSSKDLMDIVGDLSHYENDRSLWDMLRETFWWRKIEGTKSVVKRNVWEVERILARRVDKDYRNKSTCLPSYGKKETVTEKTRKLFLYLWIIDHENSFDQEIMRLCEQYWAKDVATAMNHIISHYTWWEFRIQTRQINLLVTKSLNSENLGKIEKLQEAWENWWSKIFYENISSYSSLEWLLFESAREFSKLWIQWSSFIERFTINTARNNHPIASRSFIKRICEAWAIKYTSVEKALIFLWVEELEVKSISQQINSINKRRIQTVIPCSTSQNHRHQQSVELPDDIMSSVKIIWMKEKAHIDEDMIKIILREFRWVSFEELYELLQQELIRNELIRAVTVYSRRKMGSNMTFNLLVRNAPKFIEALQKSSAK